MRILDAAGVWVMNVGSFAFSNPETGQYISNDGYTKVTDSPWLDGQPVMVKCGTGAEPSPPAPDQGLPPEEVTKPPEQPPLAPAVAAKK